ncbi:EAL domain-containing protein [bacterium]|nr:MAG: EAL domain-containing protein [bacterium]
MFDSDSANTPPPAQSLANFSTSKAELEAIYAIVRAINAHSSQQEVIDVLAKELRPFIHFDSLFISLLRDNALEVSASSRPDHGFNTVAREERPDERLWEVIDQRVLWSEDLWGHDKTRVQAFINVPLCVGTRAVGVLHLDYFSPRQWTEAELSLARLIGELIGGAVESTELLRQRDERERAHAESVALLRAIQEATSEGICLVSEKGELLSYNRRFADLWQLDDKTENFHRENGTVMSYVLEQLADPDEFLLKIAALWEQPSALAQDEITLRDGRVFERYSAPAIAPATDGSLSRQIGRVWTFSDITDRKRTEYQLAHQAFYDVVTGLPNRVLFGERLNGALKNLVRSRRSISVLFLDLDRFKVINDSLGHETGDRLLVQVATRLRDSLRPGDIAARFGGDEFVVLLEDITAIEDAVHVAERIAAALNSPFLLAGHTVSVTASIGIVICSDPHELPDDILRKADVAMYRAKNEGKARHQIFSDSLSKAAMEELQLELDLTVALKRGEIEVYYQPLVDLTNNRVEAFEALMRWHHPTRGSVQPEDFVPVAEELGLIVPIGEWVLREACQQAKHWSEQAGIPIQMHVNLSVRQFELTNMPAQLSRILREIDISPAQLLVEITESALMHDAKSTTRQLEELKQLGIGISVDDFGTGYSSLAYLEMFPLDLLKIDRAFVARMERSETLVRAVTSLGQALGMEIAAEGIESRAQLDSIRSLGVRWAQGFLFSEPLPAKEAGNWLQKSVDRMLL